MGVLVSEDLFDLADFLLGLACRLFSGALGLEPGVSDHFAGGFLDLARGDFCGAFNFIIRT